MQLLSENAERNVQNESFINIESPCCKLKMNTTRTITEDKAYE